MANNPPKPAVVCLVGLCGVGKSEAARIARELVDFNEVYDVGVVIAEIQNRGLQINPTNEAAVREDLRRRFGMGVMAERLMPEVKCALDRGQNILIDGLYSYSEYLILKQEF